MRDGRDDRGRNGRGDARRSRCGFSRAPARSAIRLATANTDAQLTTHIGTVPDDLLAKHLTIPVPGVKAEDLAPQFYDARGERGHEALDIIAMTGRTRCRGRGRDDREAVPKQARRDHDLPIRSDGNLRVLLRASRPLCRRSRGRCRGQARTGDRLCRVDRKRGHAASSFRDLQARAGEALVERRSARPLPRAQTVARALCGRKPAGYVSPT